MQRRAFPQPQFGQETQTVWSRVGQNGATNLQTPAATSPTIPPRSSPLQRNLSRALSTQAARVSTGALLIGTAALLIAIGATISLSIVLATTGRSSRRRDRRIEAELVELEALVANLTCNCSVIPPSDTNITIPQSMFIAQSTSQQNVTSGSGANVITYDTSSTKLLNLLPGMNLTSGIFTAPDDGLYNIVWSVGFNSPSPGAPTSVIFGFASISNWASEIVNINIPDTGFFTPFSGATTALLATNDTVSINIQNETPDLVTINAGSILSITKVNSIP